jgi:hypothetical protein
MLLRARRLTAQRNRRSKTGRREQKKIAQRSRDAGDDGRVEAEQYSGEACDNDDSEMRRDAHGISSEIVPAHADACQE